MTLEDEDAKLVNATELAKLLGVHRKTIARWRRTNKLPKPIVDGPHWSIAQLKKISILNVKFVGQIGTNRDIVGQIGTFEKTETIEKSS